MKFGLFSSAQASSQGAAEGFRDYLEFNIEAEALGYVSSFSVEHHFTGWSQASATLNLLTWLAARTRTLRVGTAVMVLPWHNPVLLAEQTATLDLLSDGRLDLGVGRGYRYSEFSGFGVAEEEAQARFDEGLDVLVKAWTRRERFSHGGRFWRFENIVVEPAPAQRPHPPLWMAAGSERAVRNVVARGARLLLDQFAAPAVIGERIALFARECEAAGRRFDPLDVAVARDVYVAADRAERDAALDRHRRARQRILEVARTPGRSGGSHILNYAANPEGTEQTLLYGSAQEIVARIAQLREVGVRYVLANIGGGSREALRRFAREVMPHFA